MSDTRGVLGTITGEEAQTDVEQIDFKMVTFSLAGKDYGVDIMKVKEIAKFGNFTYVPNTAPFVRGVHNLRGDIISVIDMRKMLRLPVPDEKKVEDGLILRLEKNVLGVVVDAISGVVGISSTTIQPPHPIFADINIQYIRGVVEHQEKLFIILDVDRIFAKENPAIASEHHPVPEASGVTAPVVSGSIPQGQEEEAFVRDALPTLAGFHVTSINADWFSRRFKEWLGARRQTGVSPQLRSDDDAEQFLSSFYSRNAGRFLTQEYVGAIGDALPVGQAGGLTVWNPGCGKGEESYSLAAYLRSVFPNRRVRVWAHDKDLLSISTAPNLVFSRDAVPEYAAPFLVQGINGYSFSEELKETILFEYHDLLHRNEVPECDLILCRDVLSFLPKEQQSAVLDDFYTRLKPDGVLVLGDNETVGDPGRWQRVPGPVSVFKKNRR
jgi:purine-binding chemotaxis protein CheW